MRDITSARPLGGVMGQRRRFLLMLALLLAATTATGCTRRFFRQYADRDVDVLLTEKNIFEPWQIENYHVYPDPRARFADPSDPDHPPPPPDDPAAQYLSPNPQRPYKQSGVGRIEGTGYLDVIAAWDAMNRANKPPELSPVPEGEAPTLSPKPLDPIPGTVEHPYLLTLDQCCELGLFNARDYQDQRENLYLTALPVSLQRYSFAAQFFALGNAAFQSAGDQAAVPGQRWIGSGQAGFSKLFPTGATLLAQIANNFAFDLTNGNPSVSVSNMSLALVQPLLQGGGRAVTLEPLTQSERNLLYQIRTYARFRKQFYFQVAGGGRGSGGATAALDPTIGALATQIGPTSGYLPTVRLIANLEIDQENVRRFQQYVRLFEALAEGGEVNQLQVDTLRQSLLQGQSRVLDDERQLRNSMDTFKIQLGVPPTLNMELDPSPVQPIRDQLTRCQKPIDQYQQTVDEVEDSDPDASKPKKFSAPEDAPKLRERLKLVATDASIVQGTPFRERILARWGLWEQKTNEQITQRINELREERRKLLAEKARTEGENQPAMAAISEDRKSTRLNSSHLGISYAVFCLK